MKRCERSVAISDKTWPYPMQIRDCLGFYDRRNFSNRIVQRIQIRGFANPLMVFVTESRIICFQRGQMSICFRDVVPNSVATSCEGSLLPFNEYLFQTCSWLTSALLWTILSVIITAVLGFALISLQIIISWKRVFCFFEIFTNS